MYKERKMDSCISYDTTGMLAGGWDNASIILLYLAHVSLQEACGLR